MMKNQQLTVRDAQLIKVAIEEMLVRHHDNAEIVGDYRTLWLKVFEIEKDTKINHKL